ncbi:MAG TPA: YbhB/YbcL family Raf kinase inhibitor-like protein [Bryobacteraceae bacterium]|nr:YbhB/YbcL family Raf kinase inhibitor-like protein [Bryobacteraceae bacterium]
MRIAQTLGITLAISALALTVGIASTFAQDKGKGKGPAGPGMTLTSPAFADGAEVPNKYTQAEQNPPSPKLEWTNVPAGVVTFALILHDPDVALQKKMDDVLHWAVFNIPGTARELPEGVPANAMLSDGTMQIKNLRGGVGYMGPGAPPPGPHHHYTFELFALDTKLDLTGDASRADLVKAMDGHIVAKAVYVGRFHR